MTTYNLTTSSNSARFLPYGNYSVFASIPMVTAATGDVYNLPITVPAGVYVIGCTIDSDAIDTGSTVVLALGDANSTGRLISNATSGQAAGIPQGINKRGALGYQYAAPTTLQLQVTTGSSAYQQGNVRVNVALDADVKQGGG